MFIQLSERDLITRAQITQSWGPVLTISHLSGWVKRVRVEWASSGRRKARYKQMNTYRHIRNYYLSSSKTFQDGNGNGNFEEINSNDFLDGNWESMETEGATAGAKTVTVMVIYPNFKDGNGNGNFREINSQEYREQKRHIKLFHIKLCPVTPVTGPPGRGIRTKRFMFLGFRG